MTYLRMGWPDGDGNDPNVEATIESCDQVDPGSVDQSNVVSSVQSALEEQNAALLQEAHNKLS